MFVTFISWLPNHGATYFGESSQVKGGCWLPLVSTFESLSHTVTDSDPTTGLAATDLQRGGGGAQAPVNVHLCIGKEAAGGTGAGQDEPSFCC